MKRRTFLLNLLMLLFIGTTSISIQSCSSSDDDPTTQEQGKVATLTLSDEIVGKEQNILLNLNYETDNPNILVSWFCNEKKLNSIPKSELEYNWIPTQTGKAKLKAVITDGAEMIQAETEVEVRPCDLSVGIIGDNKAKIARTFGVKLDNNIDKFISDSGNQKLIFKFNNDKLYYIYREHNYHKIFQTQSDYMLPMRQFAALFGKYKDLYGEPVLDNYSKLGKTDEDLVRYGGYIYSGSMQVNAGFRHNDKYYEIYVCPTKAYKNGFAITEEVTKK